MYSVDRTGFTHQVKDATCGRAWHLMLRSARAQHAQFHHSRWKTWHSILSTLPLHLVPSSQCPISHRKPFLGDSYGVAEWQEGQAQVSYSFKNSGWAEMRRSIVPSFPCKFFPYIFIPWHSVQASSVKHRSQDIIGFLRVSDCPVWFGLQVRQ